MTFTDAELDALVMALTHYVSADAGPNFAQVPKRACDQGAEAITYLRATLVSVLQREAETQARHDAKLDALAEENERLR